MAGIKKALAMQGIGLGLLKAKRLNPMEIFGGHGVKDLKGIPRHGGQGARKSRIARRASR